MRNPKQIVFLTFLSLIIFSLARKNSISSSPSASPSPSQLPVGSDVNHISISPSLHVDTPYTSPPAPLEYVSPSSSQAPKLSRVSPSPSHGNLPKVSPSPTHVPKPTKVSPSPSQAPKSGIVPPSPSQAPKSGTVSPSPSQAPKSGTVSPSPSQAPKSGIVSPSPSQAPKSGIVSPSPSQAPVGPNSPHISISPSLSPQTTVTPSSSPVVIDGQSNKWCGKTDQPDLCLDMISFSLKDNSDLNAAVNAAIQKTQDTARAGMEMISKLPQVESDPNFQDYLKSVQDSLDDFKNAQDAVSQKDWGTLNTMLRGALTNFGDEALPQGSDVPEITQFNEKLNKMTSNCLALGALLDPHANY